MIHELREYECLPGKLPLVIDRFRVHAMPLWRRIGIAPIGFWTTQIGENGNLLRYMLAWESLAERERKWSEFARDPQWKEARRTTEADGPLVARIRNSILDPISELDPKV